MSEEQKVLTAVCRSAVRKTCALSIWTPCAKLRHSSSQQAQFQSQNAAEPHLILHSYPPKPHPGTLDPVSAGSSFWCQGCDSALRFPAAAQQLGRNFPHWPPGFDVSTASARTPARDPAHVLCMGLCNGCIMCSAFVQADLLLTSRPPNLKLPTQGR